MSEQISTRLVVSVKSPASVHSIGRATLTLPFFDPKDGDTVGITKSSGRIIGYKGQNSRWWKTEGGCVVLEIYCGEYVLHSDIEDAVTELTNHGWKIAWERGHKPGFLKRKSD